MTAQARLADIAAGRLVGVLGQFFLDLHLRRDAESLDRAARRGVVAGRGEPKGAAAAERNDGLYRALAERARADQRRPVMILQRAGDDLRGRSRTAVDQHHDWLAVGDV